MSPAALLQTMRRRWLLSALTLIVVVVLGTLYTYSRTPSYQSTASAYVTSKSTAANANYYQDAQFVLSRMSTYTSLVTSQATLSPVIRSLQLDVTPAQLAGRVGTSNPPDTTIINVTVTGTDARQVAQIANAITTRIGPAIGELESGNAASGLSVSAKAVQQASIPTKPYSPNHHVDIAISVLVGLLAAMGVAIVRDVTDPKLRRVDQVRRILGIDRVVDLRLSSRSHRTDHRLRAQLRASDASKVLVTSARHTASVADVARLLAMSLAHPTRPALLANANLADTDEAHPDSEDGFGFSDVLAGAKIRDELRGVTDGLKEIGPGTYRIDPGALLTANRAEGVVHELGLRFDQIVFESPGMLQTPDLVVLAKALDGLVIVVDCGVTRITELEQTMELVRSANATVVGAVLAFRVRKRFIAGRGR